MFQNLTEENYILYAMRAYDNPSCIDIAEFYSDLARFKYLKRLYRRYKNTGNLDSLKVRLALNHLVISYNVFDIQSLTRLLFLKIESELWPILATFLSYLKFLPDIVEGIEFQDIRTNLIVLDQNLLIALEAL